MMENPPKEEVGFGEQQGRRDLQQKWEQGERRAESQDGRSPREATQIIILHIILHTEALPKKTASMYTSGALLILV